MPFINAMVVRKLEDEEKTNLQEAIADAVSVIPGKNAGNTVICISDGYAMYKNKEPIEGAFVEVRLFKSSPDECKGEFTKKLFDIFEKHLKIPKEKLTINFHKLDSWGANGGLMF